MPFFDFKCTKCNKIHETLIPLSKTDKSVKCPHCGKKCLKMVSTGIAGGSTPEPWEYEYTQKLKPKFVKDSKGVRHKFNPNKHKAGRKGSGQ